jgi:hypothetical protein
MGFQVKYANGQNDQEKWCREIMFMEEILSVFKTLFLTKSWRVSLKQVLTKLNTTNN